MRTRTVEYKDDNFDVKLTVSEATLLIGMRRSLLKAEEVDEKDEARRLLRQITYPDLVAATTEAEGFDPWPPGFEEFIQLPDKLIMPWEQAVYDLNPHWIGLESVEEAKEDIKKKATNSTAD